MNAPILYNVNDGCLRSYFHSSRCRSGVCTVSGGIPLLDPEGIRFYIVECCALMSNDCQLPLLCILIFSSPMLRGQGTFKLYPFERGSLFWSLHTGRHSKKLDRVKLIGIFIYFGWKALRSVYTTIQHGEMHM